MNIEKGKTQMFLKNNILDSIILTEVLNLQKKVNVVPCCYDCIRNNNFTHEEMFELGKTIALIKEKRKQS